MLQSKKIPVPLPQPREKAGTWTKELEKIVGSPGKYFHSNVLACPRLPVKVYAEVPIFIWKKCFKPVCFSIFLLSYINYHNLKQREIYIKLVSKI